MKKTKFTPTQVANILKEYELGKSVEELSRTYGISRQTFYTWRKRYAGMDAKDLKRLKELEEENTKLKRMYADVSLELDAAKYIIEKKL